MTFSRVPSKPSSLSLALVTGTLVALAAPGAVHASPPTAPEARGSVSLSSDGLKAQGTVRFGLDDEGRIQSESGTLSDAIHFETGSSELMDDEETRKALSELARFLNAYPEVEISIDGHTDSRGSVERNHELAKARADALAAWLADAGVEPSRISTKGIGEDAPAVTEPAKCHDTTTRRAPESCEPYWRKNRRVEFVVVAGSETIPKLSELSCDEARQRDRFGKGAYLYLSPALIAQPAHDQPDLNFRKTSWQGGLGVGYLFAPKGRLRVGLGLGVEFMPGRYNAVGRCEDNLTGDDLCTGLLESRINAELRLGGGSHRTWVYGLLAPGLALGRTETLTKVGFSGTLGAGLIGVVGKRGLFLGGEAGVDLMAFPSATVDEHPYESGSHNFDLKFLIGWAFGWKSAAAL